MRRLPAPALCERVTGFSRLVSRVGAIMADTSKFFRNLVGLGFLGPLFAGCGEDAEFDYSPPTADQLQQVRESWEQRDLSAQGVALVHVDDRPTTYQVRIYEHLVDGRPHYGAITIPKDEAQATFSIAGRVDNEAVTILEVEAQAAFPIVLFADGLDQSNPTMDILDWLKGPQQLLELAVFVIPVFRGRTLIYGEMAFEAEGDFCDAYDGAAADSIALLNVAAAEVPQADISRLMVRGGSRGGNVALLVAERDERVTVAVAQSAPTDFYRQEVADHYGSQYRCQFLSGKTEAQSRQRMLASSPLRFPMKPSVSRVYIDHGEQDDVVPLWNAVEMVSQLELQQVDVQYRSYPGFGHTDLGGSPDFVARRSEIYEDFLGL